METRLIITTESELRKIIGEAVSIAIDKNTIQLQNSSSNNMDLFGDMKWLKSICPIPSNTLDQLCGKNKIPGKIKFGKRVLFEKAVTLEWIRSNRCTIDNDYEYYKLAEEQIESRQKRKNRIKS